MGHICSEEAGAFYSSTCLRLGLELGIYMNRGIFSTSVLALSQ